MMGMLARKDKIMALVMPSIANQIHVTSLLKVGLKNWQQMSVMKCYIQYQYAVKK